MCVIAVTRLSNVGGVPVIHDLKVLRSIRAFCALGIFVAAAFVAPTARAEVFWQSLDHGPEDNWGYQYEEITLNRIRGEFNTTRHSLSLINARTADTETTGQCRADYKKLMGGSQPFRITVVLGYLDFTVDEATHLRSIEDYNLRRAFTETLTSPCVDANFVACGFARDVAMINGATIFRKIIFGPDGAPKPVVLRLINSMAFAQDRQIVRSAQAQNYFYEGLQGQADFLMYVGHGGFNERTQRNSLKFVRKLSEADRILGVNKAILESLGTAKPARPRLLALWGCNTWTLKNSILEKFKDLGIVHTNGVLYNNQITGFSLATLNATLGKWCKDDFEAAIRYLPSGAEPEGKPRIQGSFLRNL